MNASGVGIGAVLSVVRDGRELPVAYYSRKLSQAELNYAITELECLAIVASMQHFAVYLMGVPFTVETDHKALSFINSAKTLTGSLARWALLLQEFDFKICYHPGSKIQMLIPFLVSFPRMFPDEQLHFFLRWGRCCATMNTDKTSYACICVCLNHDLSCIHLPLSLPFGYFLC